MKLIPNVVSRNVGRQVLTMRKNSPRLLFVGGIVGVGVATVLACRATLKLERTIDDIQREVDDTKEIHTGFSDNNHSLSRDLVPVYAKGAYSLTKLYAPSVIVGGISIAALTGSHITLSRRNDALAAAYMAVTTSYEAYRERVKEELGEDKELELRYDVQKETDEVDGKKVKKRIAGGREISPYAVVFDNGNPNWERTHEYNKIFLIAKQNYFNDLLHARGHVFLNEVYDQLGFEHTQAGSVVGWVVGGTGDNHIDFGMFEPDARFLNGWEKNIILDFNVDGSIWNLI